MDNNNLLAYYYDDAKTLYEVFQRGMKVSGSLKKKNLMVCVLYVIL